LFLVAVAMAACGGGQPAGAGPTSAESSLHAFLQAAADSNVTRMADLWGTSRGPAGQTGAPADYGRRIAVMQAYLKNTQHQILTNDPVNGHSDQRVLQVRLDRAGCTRTVPFTMVWSGSQWLVYSFDLKDVGNPQRPCTPT
jgi:hypothetical protein